MTLPFVKPTVLFVDPTDDADVAGYNWYVGDAADASFLASVTAQAIEPKFPLGGAELSLAGGALPEGTYQFAVVVQDTHGNLSGAYQDPAWVSLPLDLTAPKTPVSGGIR